MSSSSFLHQQSNTFLEWLLWQNVVYSPCFCCCPPAELFSYIWGIPYHLNFSEKQSQGLLWKWKDHILPQHLWQLEWRHVIWAWSAGCAHMAFWLRKYQSKERSRKTENLFWQQQYPVTTPGVVCSVHSWQWQRLYQTALVIRFWQWFWFPCSSLFTPIFRAWVSRKFYELSNSYFWLFRPKLWHHLSLLCNTVSNPFGNSGNGLALHWLSLAQAAIIPHWITAIAS